MSRSKYQKNRYYKKKKKGLCQECNEFLDCGDELLCLKHKICRQKRMEKYRINKKLKGECRECKKLVDSSLSKSLCREHAIQRHKNRQKLSRKRKILGLCPVCGKNKPSFRKITCDSCIQNASRNRKRRFFQYRAAHFNSAFNTSLTAKQLWSLWKKQRGFSALTGRKMTLEGMPELDHILPKSKGGSHNISNLRWVLKLENRSKRNLSDEEFINLCVDVARHFARLN